MHQRGVVFPNQIVPAETQQLLRAVVDEGEVALGIQRVNDVG